jgi:hypothetical protein
MNTQRIGKIARLSNNLRDVLGFTLQNGRPAKPILEIINDSSEVQYMLGAYFGGHPITEQNLSEWKTGGGYQAWVRDQEAHPYPKIFTLNLLLPFAHPPPHDWSDTRERTMG